VPKIGANLPIYHIFHQNWYHLTYLLIGASLFIYYFYKAAILSCFLIQNWRCLITKKYNQQGRDGMNFGK